MAVVADHPGALEGQPGFEFREKVPTVRDKTRALNDDVGKHITVIRQKGNAWYLGAMTNGDAREMEIPLTFPRAGEYDARVFADGSMAKVDETQPEISTRRVDARSKLVLRMTPGGGVAAILTPLRDIEEDLPANPGKTRRTSPSVSMRQL